MPKYSYDERVNNRISYNYLCQFHGKVDDSLIEHMRTYNNEYLNELADFFGTEQPIEYKVESLVHFGTLHNCFCKFVLHLFAQNRDGLPENLQISLKEIGHLFYLNSNDGINVAKTNLKSIFVQWFNKNPDKSIQDFNDTILHDCISNDVDSCLNLLKPSDMEITQLKLAEYSGKCAHQAKSLLKESDNSYIGSFKNKVSSIANMGKTVVNTTLGTNYGHNSDEYNYKLCYTNVPQEIIQNDKVQIRMGAPIIKSGTEIKISPFFIAYLDHLKNQNKQHLYFNCMKQTKVSPSGEFFNSEKNSVVKITIDMARKDEASQVEKLMDLERSTERSNLFLVTLPSDEGILGVKLLNSTKKIATKDLRRYLKDLVCGRSKSEITDFYLSDKVKAIIFDETDDIDMVVENLLKDTFETMGISAQSDQEEITHSQAHAISFHFFKFKFKNYILNKFESEFGNSVNVCDVCKDGIDRGYLQYLYHEIFSTYKSIQSKGSAAENDTTELNSLIENLSNKLSFESIHAAAYETKGRLMNHHFRYLLNTLNNIHGFRENISEYARSKDLDDNTKLNFTRMLQLLDSEKQQQPKHKECNLVWNSNKLHQIINHNLGNQLMDSEELYYCKAVVTAVDEYIEEKPHKIFIAGQDAGQERIINLYQELHSYLTDDKKLINEGLYQLCEKYKNEKANFGILGKTDFARILTGKLDEYEKFKQEGISMKEQHLIIPDYTNKGFPSILENTTSENSNYQSCVDTVYGSSYPKTDQYNHTITSVKVFDEVDSTNNYKQNEDINQSKDQSELLEIDNDYLFDMKKNDSYERLDYDNSNKLDTHSRIETSFRVNREPMKRKDSEDIHELRRWDFKTKYNGKDGINPDNLNDHNISHKYESEKDTISVNSSKEQITDYCNQSNNNIEKDKSDCDSFTSNISKKIFDNIQNKSNEHNTSVEQKIDTIDNDNARSNRSSKYKAIEVIDNSILSENEYIEPTSNNTKSLVLSGSALFIIGLASSAMSNYGLLSLFITSGLIVNSVLVGGIIMATVGASMIAYSIFKNCSSISKQENTENFKTKLDI